MLILFDSLQKKNDNDVKEQKLMIVILIVVVFFVFFIKKKLFLFVLFLLWDDEGHYEVDITVTGHHLAGSPFKVHRYCYHQMKLPVICQLLEPNDSKLWVNSPLLAALIRHWLLEMLIVIMSYDDFVLSR